MLYSYSLSLLQSNTLDVKCGSHVFETCQYLFFFKSKWLFLRTQEEFNIVEKKIHFWKSCTIISIQFFSLSSHFFL